MGLEFLAEWDRKVAGGESVRGVDSGVGPFPPCLGSVEKTHKELGS